MVFNCSNSMVGSIEREKDEETIVARFSYDAFGGGDFWEGLQDWHRVDISPGYLWKRLNTTFA